MTPKTNRKTSQDMTSQDKTSQDETSQDMAPRRTRAPHLDKARDPHEAIIEDPGETADSGRDLARGEGGSIGLPETPGDLSKDD